MREYRYEALEADEIRLVELQAGAVASELHGVIHKFRLPEDEEPAAGHEVLVTRQDGSITPSAPQYCAVSYVWGNDTKPRHSIHILQDGRLTQLPIKPNLHEALVRLRQEVEANGSQMYWADAICINQASNPEKNLQIQKMAMIYNRADAVTVWLGPEDADSERAIAFINTLLNLEAFDPLTRDPGTPAEWAALHTFMQRPWFTRRWIVQEISLARRATLYCGGHFVPWPDFSAAAALFAARYRDLRILFQGSPEFHNHPNYLGEVEALGAKALVDITTNLFRKSDDGVVLERMLSLEALISTLTLFEAGTSHDTIYAVLWLAHDAEPYAMQSAMSVDPLVRTPTQSPELEPDLSQFEFTQAGYTQTQRVYGDFVHSPREVSPSAATQQDDPNMLSAYSHISPSAATQQDIISKSGATRRDTFLKPPRRRPTGSKPARSASDLSKMRAEATFHAQPHSITVDYDMDIFEVYQQFLDFAMSRSRSLDIICHPWAPEPLSRDHALPSWIPQLSSAPFEKRPGSHSYGRVRADSLVGLPGISKSYNASGKTKMYPHTGFIQGRTLIATGFVLDAIGKRSSAAVSGVIPSNWLDLVGWSGPPEPLPERFWRTLVADRDIGGQRYPPAYFPLACKWVFEQRRRRGNVNTSELLEHGKCPSIATEYLRRVQSVVWERTLALTQGRKGGRQLLALIPQEAEEGDFICILYGCSVPVILRRQRRQTKRKAEEGEGDQLYTIASTESSSSASAPGRIGTTSQPQISFSRGSTTTAFSDAETSAPPIFGLNAPSQRLDTSYASIGVRRAIGDEQGAGVPEPRLPISLDSQHTYSLIGECYVHGMMQGEGFKYQKDHADKLRSLRAFHLT